MRKYVLFGAVICLAVSRPIPAQSDLSSGKAWSQLDYLTKFLYVKGLKDGASIARTIILQLHKQRAETSPIPGLLPFDSVAVNATRDFADMTAAKSEPLIQLMDKIYLDPANACIIPLVAYSVATMMLNGRPATDVEEYLRRSRRSSAPNC